MNNQLLVCRACGREFTNSTQRYRHERKHVEMGVDELNDKIKQAIDEMLGVDRDKLDMEEDVWDPTLELDTTKPEDKTVEKQEEKPLVQTDQAANVQADTGTGIPTDKASGVSDAPSDQDDFQKQGISITSGTFTNANSPLIKLSVNRRLTSKGRVELRALQPNLKISLENSISVPSRQDVDIKIYEKMKEHTNMDFEEWRASMMKAGSKLCELCGKTFTGTAIRSKQPVFITFDVVRFTQF